MKTTSKSKSKPEPGADKGRTPIRGAGWKKKSTIATDKYEAITTAILASLTIEPVKFTELVERVAKRLPDFEGSVGWYTISCARELEVQGKLVRYPKPVLYGKPRTDPA